MRLRDIDGDDLERKVMNHNFTFGWFVKWFLILSVFFAVVGVIGNYVGLFGQTVNLPAKIASKTLTPENAIANYEWFKQQYQDVKAMDVRLGAARSALDSQVSSAGERDKWTFEDKQEYARLNTILLGLQGQRAAMVAEYNARTQMLNRDLFRTSDLPAEIE